MQYIDLIIKVVEMDPRPGSVWKRATREDSIQMLLDVCDNGGKSVTSNAPDTWDALEKELLDGAQDWKEYSWGGCALCYDRQIARHYCTASELRITGNGARRPNKKEEWLDLQARGLYQSAQRIRAAYESLQAGETSKAGALY